MAKLSQEQINVDLFDEVSRLKKEIESLKCTLSSCKYHAERIVERDYGESMDAHSIIEEVTEILGGGY